MSSFLVSHRTKKILQGQEHAEEIGCLDFSLFSRCFVFMSFRSFSFLPFGSVVSSIFLNFRFYDRVFPYTLFSISLLSFSRFLNFFLSSLFSFFLSFLLFLFLSLPPSPSASPSSSSSLFSIFPSFSLYLSPSLLLSNSLSLYFLPPFPSSSTPLPSIGWLIDRAR